MENRIMAGTSRADITPPLGYLLEGHGARNKPSEKVHDPLELTVLSLSKGKNRAVIVSCDLLCFTWDFINYARKEISEKTGLLPCQVLICASHTHTGPFMLDLLGDDPANFVPEYSSILGKKIAGAVMEAVKKEEDVGVRYGRRDVDMGIVNRRRKNPDGTIGGPDPLGPADYEVSVLSFEKEHGNPLAILFNYGCHPTTLAANIYQVSADYPGAAKREIERFYPGTTALFTNSCFGDVRPNLLDEKGENFRGGSFEDLERMGRLLASGVIQAREKAVPLTVDKLESRLEEFPFPIDKRYLFMDEDTLEKNFPLLVYKFRKTYEPLKPEIKWKEFWKEKLIRKEKVPESIGRDIHIIKIGGVKIVGIPGEAVAETGLKIKKMLGTAFTVGVSNGYLSYMPSAGVLEEGGYEASLFFYQDYPGPFAPDTEKRMLEKILSMAGE
ncbi:MAG TPA: neutral/alkaline non-lysosomal ceramidase N-terminal domain-containing protein [bacterium]|nr:neutral/alkaline non-lysosomal ceramidase N-terminal domain-containing protein [bacterium]